MPASPYSDVPLYTAGTLVFNTLIAAALATFGGGGFGANFVYSQCIGLLTYACIDLPRRWFWPQTTPALVPMIALALVAAPIGWFGGSRLAGALLGDVWDPERHGQNAMFGFLALTAVAGLCGTLFFWARERLATSERGAAEARLKLLQAQIEPHFLFNTLANLQALIGTDPGRAQTMLRHLDGYLRATLATTRSEHCTLGEEFALLRGYLEILAIRMGPRLSYSLELPDALAGTRLPPMLLQPLVENAIRHGLEPKVEGGRVRVAASAEGGRLQLCVEDDGLGFGSAGVAGTGVGLAHVQARLAAVYGAGAALESGATPGGGARIVLRLPLQS